MSVNRFHIPVTIQLGRIDRTQVVTTTAEAAEILLRRWPAERGEKHFRAMKACLETIRGGRPSNFARRAFIAAAQEARVLVPDAGSETPDTL